MPPFAIRRPRLEALIDAHPDRQVLVVHGPAGAGKSVLVAQWLTARPAGTCWLPIDRSCDDPRLLVQHLSEAAQQLFPDDPVTPPAVGLDLDDGALRHLLDAAGSRPGRAIHLVLDGVDRLHDTRSLRVVARLVERPPDGVHVILIARSKPRLGIERARLRGDLIDIGPTALRFDRGEIDALAATWTGRPVDTAQLEQATLGWAGGLRLAELATGADEAGRPGLRDAGGVADDYIREELIDGSTPELRSFLSVTCWLPLITGPLCAAVAGQGTRTPPMTLSHVQALPLLPVASRPGALRYPPILVQALHREYRRRDPRAATLALCRAAEAARRCHEPVTAVELFLEAGRAAEAAEACADLAAAGESSLRHLDELFHRRPEIAPVDTRWLPWRIRAAVAAGHIDESTSLLQHLGEPPSAGDAADVPDPADDQNHLMARAAVAERLGDVRSMLTCAERLLAHVAGNGQWTTTQMSARLGRLRAFVWSGDIVRAKAELARLEPRSDAQREAIVPLALARAWVAWLDGDISLVGRLVATAEEPGTGDHLAEIALLAGIVHREHNRLAPAMARLQEARSAAHNVLASLAASELARCHRAAGATMEALELVVSARSSCPVLPPAVDVHLRATEALVRLHGDDVVGAHTVVRGAPPGVDAQLLAARIALRQAPGRAPDLVESAATSTRRQAVEKLLLRAQLPDATSADVEVAAMKAVHLGASLGLQRTFLDEGPDVCHRLAELAGSSNDRALGRIAALARQARRPPPNRRSPPSQRTGARVGHRRCGQGRRARPSCIGRR